MRFIALKASSLSSIRPSSHKLAGLAAALLVLPMAVACGGETTTEAGGEADVTSEMPSELSEDVAEGSLDSELAEALMGGAGESIFDVAASNGSFNTLVAAVQAAGLEETLEADGPYTVFAPTDEAFAALPMEIVEKLVKPENQAVLQDILAYHVVDGAVSSEDIESGALSTLEGDEIEIAVDAVGVTVNGSANVVQPDVTAENGVIHVVDTVLLPPTFDAATLM